MKEFVTVKADSVDFDDLRQDIIKFAKDRANKAAVKVVDFMKQASLGKVEPDIVDLNEKDDGSDGVRVTINKPDQLREVEKLRLGNRAWGQVKTWMEE